MSKHTTLDQFKMLVQRTKTEIDKVDTKVDNLTQREDDIATVGGEPSVIVEIKNNGPALAVTDMADMTARYVEVSLGRKATVLDACHNALLPKEAERIVQKN